MGPQVAMATAKAVQIMGSFKFGKMGNQTGDQLDEPSAIVEGYNSYFSFSRGRSGYSGVATFVKDTATPVRAEEGLSGLHVQDEAYQNIGYHGNRDQFTDEELHALDNEGRCIITQHKLMTDSGEGELLTIFNVYCPRADPEKEERKEFKLQFCKLLQTRAEAVLESGSHVIILGDINISCKKIDTCDPAEDEVWFSNPSRKWLNEFLLETMESSRSENITEKPREIPGQKFVDTFRYYHPTEENAYTCWCTVTGARATNYGTRIDYILANQDLAFRAFTDCVLMPEVEGSDHCPVTANIDWEVLPSKQCPPQCTKYLPEFSGRQQKLSSFFKKSSKSSEQTIVTKEDSKTVSILSSQECKRKLPNISHTKTKKIKTEDKRQGNLMAFFGKRPKPDTSQTKSFSQSMKEKVVTQNNDIHSNLANRTLSKTIAKSCLKSDHSNKFGETLTASNTSTESETEVLCQKKTASAWKTILKGPPQPSFCKGHNEPCVLRTVKKEGPNKSRQFWVCNRPEGHKSNREARCDHFEWVPKR